MTTLEFDITAKSSKTSRGTSNSNRSTEDIEQEIAKVLEEIKSIDKHLKGLNNRRVILTNKFEQLNEEKSMNDSEAIATEQNWESESFSWSETVRETLKNVFKLTKFRSQQMQTINCVMAGKDTILITPTGGGKSLCYQLPAVMSTGLTIVISPLISLMEDQVWALKKFGIEAEYLSASREKDKNNIVLKQLRETKNDIPFKLLYVTPERLVKSKTFMNALQKCYLAKKLSYIAIDEVHCCSQWGHDFRPDYKYLGTLKTMFPDISILGVTATATNKVILDVQKMLNLRQAIVLKAPFNRPNLYYHVIEKPSDKEKCMELLSDLLSTRYGGKSGIIYAFSISDTEDIASSLVSKGLNVRPYHANLTAERRTKIHQNWLTGEIQAVVATIAFGMGIDKQNVRFVIHHTISKSLENFYQESGRAGRDGLRAECILMYRYLDMFKITTMMFTEHTGLRNAYEMVEYAIDGFSCRRDLIAKHFLEVWNSAVECNSMCDRCYHKDSVQIPKINIVNYCLDLYKIIDRAKSLDIKLTALKLIDAWYHKKIPNLRIENIEPPKHERYYGEQMITLLILKGYLKEDFHFSAYSTISYIRKGDKIATETDRIIFYGARVLHLPDSNSKLWCGTEDDDCTFVTEHKNKTKKKSKKSREGSISSSIEGSAFSANSSKRQRKSSESNHYNDTQCESDHSVTKKKKNKKSKNKSMDVSGIIEITDDGYKVIADAEENIIKIEDDG